MTIYIDEILFLNFFFDFILLMSTNIILKRNVLTYRIIIGAFIGSLSTLTLFFKINSIELFILKTYLAFLMTITTFGYKTIKIFLKTLTTLYIVSILLGGFLYYLNLEFSYSHKGLLFFNKGASINIIFLVIISPIILYIYIKNIKSYKRKIKNTYKVNIYIGNKILKLNGFLDSGNTLSFKGKPVIITSLKNKFKNKKYYVLYNTAQSTNILECIKVKKVEVIGLKTFKNIYLGFSKNISEEVLLNGKMEE